MIRLTEGFSGAAKRPQSLRKDFWLQTLAAAQLVCSTFWWKQPVGSTCYGLFHPASSP